MTAQPSSEKSRMIQLDILRGIAILMVLGNHNVVDPHQAGLFKAPATLIARIGWTGVDLFFVLSGFLVGGLLLRELKTRGALDVRRFLVRRGFKIWPSYYLYLVAVFLLMLWQTGGAARATFWKLLPNFLHLQNYNILGNPQWAGPDRGHTWSLSVEEHFYLLLPLLLLFLSRRNLLGLKAIPWIALGLGVVCLGLRLPNLHRPFHHWTHQVPTHLRIDSLFFGVLLAYWYHFHPELFARLAERRRLLIVLGLVLISPMAVLAMAERPFVWTIGYTLLYLGYGCLLIVAVSTCPGEGWLGRLFATRSARALAWIGGFSYSIYLWHPEAAQDPFFALVRQGFLSELPMSLRWLVVTGLYVLTAVMVGVLLGKLVERPALALRERLFPARALALGPDLPTAAVVSAELLPESRVDPALS